MIYKWFYEFSDSFSILNVFQYISVRSFVAFFTTFIICWLWGPSFIRRMNRKQMNQSIREDGPKSHFQKAGTPTMGGVLMLVGFSISAFFWTDLMNPLVLSAIVVTLGFGMVGYIDDLMKVMNKNSSGISGKLRLFLEFLISGIVIYYLIAHGDLSTELSIPFFKNVVFELGWWYILFASLVVVGCANAVNLTDGLDGLAIVPIIICSGTYMILAYIAGHFNYAHYLAIPFISGAGDLTPLAASVVAAGLGFLWYNSYPAQVFMGDVGSLGLGGFLGIMAVLTKNELLLLLLGGVFVAEALSVITQVVSFKLTGKRVFRMAPIHHHFELKGVVESKIIVRFWIISILLAVLSLSTLKLR